MSQSKIMYIKFLSLFIFHLHVQAGGLNTMKYDSPDTIDLQGISINTASPKIASLQVSSINCEYQHNPIGIDAANPRLSWQLRNPGKERGIKQTAYQIQVASSRQHLLKNEADLWDSGVIDTIQSNNIKYKGKALVSAGRYFWRVRIRDDHGNFTSWSEPGFWEMGLLKKSDWQGKWIGKKRNDSLQKRKFYEDEPAPLFRREFSVDKKIKKATLYVSGLGYYEAYLNGGKIGNRHLDPAWTNYDKRVLYSTFDVTDGLIQGKNCMGIMLGNGWYDPLPLKMWGRRNIRESMAIGHPKFIVQMNVEYSDGTTTKVVSDENWSTKHGPILQNSIYLGEKYDARLQIPDWNKCRKELRGWEQASIMEAPAGNLHASAIPPIVVGDTLIPISIKKISGDRIVVDFGRNFAGVISISASGMKGQTISLKYGELLYTDGSVNVMTGVAGQIKKKGVGGEGAPDTAYAKDIFILSGRGKDLFQPHFTFHGFRYVEITGYPGDLEKADITGLAMHSDVKTTGTFSCSNSLINNIQQICLNTFKSNIFSVQSDCPQRERFGYGGDIAATSEAFLFNYDMSGFYEKTAVDFADDAQPDGGLTETAPYVGIAGGGLGGKSGPVEWGSALPILMHQLYQYYGNSALMKDLYPVAKRWVDFMHRKSKGNIIPVTIGDHESIDEKLVDMSATAYYFYNTRLLSTFAGILDEKKDQEYYERLSDSIRSAFINKYAISPDGSVGSGTAAAQAYALYFGLNPETSREKVIAALMERVRKNGYHITSGIFGTKLLLNVLSETGNVDAAFKMAMQKTYPGWGYMIENGATTLWEVWAFSDNVYSHNHPMFGSISEWFYKYLGGIRPGDNAVGFDKIIIQPYMKEMEWANTSYQSILGTISSNWVRNGNHLTLKVEIPVNATARVLIPSSFQRIKENGKPLSEHRDIRIVNRENDQSILEINSGTYVFTTEVRQD